MAQPLIAEIVPGVLMDLLYFTYVVGRCLINQNLAPAYQQERFRAGKADHRITEHQQASTIRTSREHVLTNPEPVWLKEKLEDPEGGQLFQL